MLCPGGYGSAERIPLAYVDSDYDRVDSRPRRFVDRRNSVTVDVLISDRFPGSGRPGPIAFPDPAQVSEQIAKIHVLKLIPLIELKLAAGRHYDFGDVVYLI